MKAMKPMKPTQPPRSAIPCYAADGAPLGYRPLDAAQRLLAGGYVRPSYGRKGHLRAIWLLRDDGTSPVRSHAHQGTRYSFIATLENGRCWQLRRLDRPDTTTADGAPVTGRDPFFQVIRGCLAPSPDALATDAMATVAPTPATLARSLATSDGGHARSPAQRPSGV